MKLDKVTITGADDSIRPEELLPLTKQYPFVEWGILLSAQSIDTKRFPSASFLANLNQLKKQHPEMKLAGHVCGSWVRRLLTGDFNVLNLNIMLGLFERIQLNFHSVPHNYKEKEFFFALKQRPNVQFIFQLDGVNDELLNKAVDAGINAVGLYDTSGGNGVLPHYWPTLPEGAYRGYAGGLGPDNLAEQLAGFDRVIKGDRAIWIDMGTKVRSFNDSLFDLLKVRQCLEIAKPYTR